MVGGPPPLRLHALDASDRPSGTKATKFLCIMYHGTECLGGARLESGGKVVGKWWEAAND